MRKKPCWNNSVDLGQVDDWQADDGQISPRRENAVIDPIVTRRLTIALPAQSQSPDKEGRIKRVEESSLPTLHAVFLRQSVTQAA